jgi:hypothetical protein
MTQNIHKFLIALAICLSATSAPLIHALSPTTKIRYATALLRGPAACLEHKFRNDTSLRARAIKMAIHGIRILDDSLVPTPGANDYYSLHEALCELSTWHHLVSWFIYDIVAFIKNGKACIKGERASPVVITDGQEHEFLCSTILPIAEMICALARITPIARKSNNLANIAISIVRLCELYYATPNDSVQRTALKSLLAVCVVELIVKSKRLYELPHTKQEDYRDLETFIVDKNFVPTCL